MNLERIALIAAKECIRQQVGIKGLADLIKTYELAHENADRPPTEIDAFAIAARVNGRDLIDYRSTPVTFPDMTIAPHWSVVRDAMRSMFNYPANQYLINGRVDETDEWIKNFLDIHPFGDGNGRTAWILRTWLLKQWDNPEELPDYYQR